MKINWKVVVALVLIVAASYWVMDSLRSSSYSGANLTFGVAGGPVTMTNPSDAPVAVQLVGTGTRSFTITSTIDGVAGSSTRQGTGSTATQLYEFALPVGSSEFTVARGTNVNFVANTETNLEAMVRTLNPNDSRTTVIVAGLFILGMLFYMSNTTGHFWIKSLLGRDTAVLVPMPAVEANNGGQGRTARPYGDNRT